MPPYNKTENFWCFELSLKIDFSSFVTKFDYESGIVRHKSWLQNWHQYFILLSIHGLLYQFRRFFFWSRRIKISFSDWFHQCYEWLSNLCTAYSILKQLHCNLAWLANRWWKMRSKMTTRYCIGNHSIAIDMLHILNFSILMPILIEQFLSAAHQMTLSE